MCGMMGVFAEFERSLIQERVKTGLQRAKTQGKRLGRPPVPPIQIEKIKRLRTEALSYRKIATDGFVGMQSPPIICVVGLEDTTLCKDHP